MKNPSVFKNKRKLYTCSTSEHWLCIKGKSSNMKEMVVGHEPASVRMNA